jgi:Sulfotransferase domain
MKLFLLLISLVSCCLADESPSAFEASVDFRIILRRLFDSFCGGCIKLRILPPQKESKIGQNNPENRRSLQSQTDSEWQRVYLASYPRSGNHWMRYLIEEATHITTSSVYRDPDKPHLPKPFPWKAYCTDHGYNKECRFPKEGEIVVVKTHFPHLVREPGDEQPYVKAVHIVRHPVDSLYSLYVHSQNGRPKSPVMPRETLMGFIYSMREFDAYWTAKENVYTLRYEDLSADPFSELKKVLEFIGYQVADEDIERAVAKHPPQGDILKHLFRYPSEDVEYIKSELSDFLLKYDYQF